MALTDDTRIIFIHGLASKPPAGELLSLWKRALVENVRVDSSRLADAMESNPNLFRFAYWANAVPDHLEDSPRYVRSLKLRLDSLIQVRKELGNDLHISRRGWVNAQLKKLGVGIVNTMATALTIKDDVIDEHVREVAYYRGDQLIADRIRGPLEDELRSAWNDGKYVAILSHSMGTFIAYDVLWRFSHRNEPAYRRYRGRKVDHLITFGSPLGDAGLRDYMLVERWKKSPNSKLREERKRFYPTNLRSWHNYSALGDVICHDSTLEDDFFQGMREHLKGYGKDDFRDYVKLYNPYRNENGKSNPHKSFGYLIQPKLSYNLRWYFDML